MTASFASTDALFGAAAAGIGAATALWTAAGVALERPEAKGLREGRRVALWYGMFAGGGREEVRCGEGGGVGLLLRSPPLDLIYGFKMREAKKMIPRFTFPDPHTLPSSPPRSRTTDKKKEAWGQSLNGWTRTPLASSSDTRRAYSRV